MQSVLVHTRQPVAPCQIHRDCIEQGREVLLRFPDLRPSSRHHHRQLRKSVQNRTVNVFFVSCWFAVQLAERLFDRIAAYHMNSNSPLDGFPNDGTNYPGNLCTPGPIAITRNSWNKQGMRREVIKKIDQVRNCQARDSDRRCIVAASLDATIVKITVLKVCPRQSSASRINRQGST